MKKGSHHSPRSKEKLRRALKRAGIKGLLTGRPKAVPIYELAHGIKVISESFRGTYVFCTLEKHRLFPNSRPNAAGRISVQRARVVMTAKLGRVLKRGEHVHHKNEKRKKDDRLSNLEVLTAAEHNRHHKTGAKHKASSKRKTSETLRRMHAEGLIKPARLFGKDNPFFGKHHTEATRKKMRGPRKKKK